MHAIILCSSRCWLPQLSANQSIHHLGARVVRSAHGLVMQISHELLWRQKTLMQFALLIPFMLWSVNVFLLKLTQPCNEYIMSSEWWVASAAASELAEECSNSCSCSSAQYGSWRHDVIALSHRQHSKFSIARRTHCVRITVMRLRVLDLIDFVIGHVLRFVGVTQVGVSFVDIQKNIALPTFTSSVRSYPGSLLFVSHVSTHAQKKLINALLVLADDLTSKILDATESISLLFWVFWPSFAPCTMHLCLV